MVGDNEANKKRTVEACDRCRLKKIKCDGHIPCLRCKKADAICHFSHSTRSEGKSIPAVHVHQLQVQNEILVKTLRTMWTRYGDATDKKVLTHHIVQSLEVLNHQPCLFKDMEDSPNSFRMYEQQSSASQSVIGEHSSKPFDDTGSTTNFDTKDPDIKKLRVGTYLDDGMDFSNPTASYSKSSIFDHVPLLTDDDSPSDKTSPSSVSAQSFHNDNNKNNNIAMHTLQSLEPLHEQKQSSWPAKPHHSSLNRANRPKDKVPMPPTYRDELMQHHSLQQTVQQPLGFPSVGISGYDLNFAPANLPSDSPAGLDFNPWLTMGDINNDTLHWYYQS